MSDKNQNIAGRGVYLELESNDSVVQLVIFPDLKMTGALGSIIPSGLYRRRLSEAQSRTTWKHYQTRVMATTDENKNFVQHSKKMAELNGRLKLDYTSKMFTQLVSLGYKVRVKPIVFEISKDDLPDIYAQKTPYKILNRISKARKALGFPASVL